jgi:hypothetical protein
MAQVVRHIRQCGRGLISEAGGDAARSPGWHPELLPRAGSLQLRAGHPKWSAPSGVPRIYAAFIAPENIGGLRAIDLRCLERWNRKRRKPALRHMGVDEIYLGKKTKFLTVVSNLETGERSGLDGIGSRKLWMLFWARS